MATVEPPPEIPAAPVASPARPPGATSAGGSPRSLLELVLHLARREIAITHRFTLLGWAWPLTRQLVQLAVLVLVFGSVLDLNIDNYPVFVFSGLIAWTWFLTGVGNASTSLLAQRHLVFKAGFPTIVLPLVAVTVPLIDVAMATPVLLILLATSGQLQLSALLLPALFAIELLLVCGIAWLVAAATVYVRDTPNIVLVALNTLFYLTPVFYSTSRVPDRFRWVLRLNPMTTLLDADRSILLGEPFPPVGLFVAVILVSIVLAGLGFVVFRRVAPGFVDEL